MSKAIRNKLNLSKSEKSSSYCESISSFDHEKLESGATTTTHASVPENGNARVDSKEQSSSSSAGTPAGDKQAPQLKVTKKKSKLCLLL